MSCTARQMTQNQICITLLEKESLGISLKSCLGGYGAYVDQISDAATNKRDVQVGDLLCKVEDTDVSMFSVAEVYTLLRTMQRPLTIIFWRSNHIAEHVSIETVINDLRNTNWIKKQLKLLSATTNDNFQLQLWSKFTSAREWLHVLLRDDVFLPVFHNDPTLLPQISTEPSFAPYFAASNENSVSLYHKCVTALQQFLQDTQQTASFKAICSTFLQSDSCARYQAYFIRQQEFLFTPLSLILKSQSGLLSFASILPSRGFLNGRLLNLQRISSGNQSTEGAWVKYAIEFAIECSNKGYLRMYYESAAYSWIVGTLHPTQDQHSFLPLPSSSVFSMLPPHVSLHHIPEAKSQMLTIKPSDEQQLRVRFNIYLTQNEGDNNTHSYSFSVQAINYALSRYVYDAESIARMEELVDFVQSPSVMRLLCPQITSIHRSSAKSIISTNMVAESNAINGMLLYCYSRLTIDNTLPTFFNATTNKPSTITDNYPNKNSNTTIEFVAVSSKKMSESMMHMANTAMVEARRRWTVTLPVATQSLSSIATQMAAGANKLLVSKSLSMVSVTGAIEDEEQHSDNDEASTVLLTHITQNDAVELQQEDALIAEKAHDDHPQQQREDQQTDLNHNSDSTTQENSPVPATPQLIGECNAVISTSPLLFSLRNCEHIIMQTDAVSGVGTRRSKVEEFGYDLIAELLSPTTFTVLFLAYLLEIPIIILTSSLELTSIVILKEFLNDAIKPLTWPHINAANIPSDMAVELLSCPTPFFVGIHGEDFVEYCRKEDGWDRGDVLVVHLDDDSIQWPEVGRASEEMQVIRKLSIDLNVGEFALLKEIFRVMHPVRYQLILAEDSESIKIDNKSREYNRPFPEDLLQEFLLLSKEGCRSNLSNKKSEQVLLICQLFVRQLLHGWRYCSVIVTTNQGQRTLCFDEDEFYQLKKCLQRTFDVMDDEEILLSEDLQPFYTRWMRSQGLSLYLIDQA